MVEHRWSLRLDVSHGIVGGLVAGVVFAVVEAGLAVLLGESPIRPVRIIGSMVLGPQSISDPSLETTSILVGTALHLGLSALYGAIFAVVLWILFRRNMELGATTLILGVGYAVILWIVNFLVIAPIFFDQLRVESPFWFSFTIAHAFYGAALGAYLILVTPGKEREPETDLR